MATDEQSPAPVSRDALCERSASTLQQQIRTGEVSPVDLVESCIERINAVNPIVNAVVTTCFERAREEATQAKRLVEAGTTLPALHGIPLLIKDLSDTQGVKTTYGSRCFETHIPTQDALIVARLREAGAIVMGKTNTPEFGAGANTTNRVFGPTRNPFDQRLTCGGSSGGSAVALACGMSVLATGSDLGGSLRIPASFCSVVGMRPSPGVVASRSHVCGFSPLWTDGPMARNIADATLCLQAITGYEPSDPLSRPQHPRIDFNVEPVELQQLRVGFSSDLGVAAMDDHIAALFSERIECLQDHFLTCTRLPIDLCAAESIFRVLRAESLYASHATLAENQSHLLSDNVNATMIDASTFSLADTAKANAQHTQLFRSFQRLFDDCDVILCPATAVSPFSVDKNHPTSINGKALDNYYQWYAITWALSLTGCPVVTVPCGLDKRGLPFGIQIVGPRYSDQSTLNVAQALENALNTAGIGRVQPKITHLAAQTPNV